MGIPKLTKYLRENKHFCGVYLKQVATKLVIDGFALCYALHCGILCGNHFEFYNKVVEFFKKLKSIGIEAFVVVDGVDHENKKEDTNRHRLEHRLKLLEKNKSQRERLASCEAFLPSFAKIVFVDALHERNVKFFVADGEADRDIVSLANHLQCPVFGRDSDFFIFNIEHGVILFSDNPEDIFESKELEFFKYQNFVSRCNFASPQILLFLPYCLGNDFHPGRRGVPQLQISNDADVSVIVEQLGTTGVSSIEDYKPKLCVYEEFYSIAPQSFEYLSRNSFFSEPSFPIPAWIVSHFKQGAFSRDMFSFLASSGIKTWKYVLMFEDLSKTSVWKVTDGILKFVIGTLLTCCDRSAISKIFVVVRKDSTTELENIDISDCLEPTHFHKIEIGNVHKIPKEDRKKIILDIFHFKSKSRKLNDIPDSLQLFVVATRSWLRKIHKTEPVNEAFIVALVLCAQKCFESNRPERRCYVPNEMKALDQIHYLAQWECMFYIVNIFNQILDYPFVYTSLGRLFSATRFQDYFVVKPLFTKLDDTGRTMYNVIVKEYLPEAPLLCQHQADPGQPQIGLQNRFDALATLK